MDDNKKAVARVYTGYFYSVEGVEGWYYTNSEPEATACFYENSLYINSNGIFYRKSINGYNELQPVV